MAEQIFRNQKSVTKADTPSALQTVLNGADYPNITKVESTGEYVYTTIDDVLNQENSPLELRWETIQKFDYVYYHPTKNKLYRSEQTMYKQLKNTVLIPVGICIRTPQEYGDYDHGIIMSLNGGTYCPYVKSMKDFMNSTLSYQNTANYTGEQLTNMFYTEWVNAGKPKDKDFRGNDLTPWLGAAPEYAVSGTPFTAGHWYCPSIRELYQMFPSANTLDQNSFLNAGLGSSNFVKLPCSDFLHPINDTNQAWGEKVYPINMCVSFENWNTQYGLFQKSGKIIAYGNWNYDNWNFAEHISQGPEYLIANQGQGTGYSLFLTKFSYLNIIDPE